MVYSFVLFVLCLLYYIECSFNWDLYSSDFVPGVFVCSSLDEVDVILGWYWTTFYERNLEYDSDPEHWEEYCVSQLHPRLKVIDSEGNTYRCDTYDLNLLEDKLQDYSDCPWVTSVIDSIRWNEWTELGELPDGTIGVREGFGGPFIGLPEPTPVVPSNPATARPVA